MPAAYGVDSLEVSVETVLDNIRIPWDAEFADDGRLFITTRPGIMYTVYNGTASEILRLDVGGGEGGMLGVALHPEYDLNGMLYVYHTSDYNRVDRYVYGNSSLAYDRAIIAGIPSASVHNGGRIDFGPDGMLYVGTGDAGNAALSQNVTSVAGKILRLDPDGYIPEDNPFEDSPVYAYGLRNPQGMAWDKNGTMFVTDHGPSGFYNRAHDEINVVVSGGNYGWPLAIGSDVLPGMIPPLLHSGDATWAPSGMAYIVNGSVPQWDNMLLYGALRGQHVGVVSVDGDRQTILEGELGRIRHVFQHPDGSIYLLTSNTDGRGSPSPNDDVMVRITGVAEYQCSMPAWLSFLC